jgi:hypothetical protein
VLQAADWLVNPDGLVWGIKLRNPTPEMWTEAQPSNARHPIRGGAAGLGAKKRRFGLNILGRRGP